MSMSSGMSSVGLCAHGALAVNGVIGPDETTAEEDQRQFQQGSNAIAWIIMVAFMLPTAVCVLICLVIRGMLGRGV